jgi:hypothetical protein
MVDNRRRKPIAITCLQLHYIAGNDPQYPEMAFWHRRPTILAQLKVDAAIGQSIYNPTCRELPRTLYKTDGLSQITKCGAPMSTAKLTPPARIARVG